MDKEYLGDVAKDISYDIRDITEDVECLKRVPLYEVESKINFIVGLLDMLRNDFESFSNDALKMIPDDDEKIEILKPKKKLGDMKCSDYSKCNDCTLKCLACDNDNYDNTLYTILKKTCKNEPELYDFYKKRLDKEVDE